MGKKIDLTGQRFGKLVATKETNKRNYGSVVWECQCDCGETALVTSGNLRSGHTQSCGCGQIIDLVGQKFNHLTAIYSISDPNNGRLWYCRFDCGKTKKNPVSGYALKANKIKDCGCIKKPSGMYKHGKSNTKIYNVWTAMKQRCLKENDRAYVNYGGRGIAVYEEWLSFIPFYEWAMNSGYKEGLTLERIDNDGNYEPPNCTWIPKSEQTSNRRINKHITYKGKTKIMKDWAKELGFDYHVIQSRITKLGWSIEKAFETPANKLGTTHIRLILHNGKTQSIAEWSRELSVNYKTLHGHISSGKTIEQLLNKLKC